MQVNGVIFDPRKASKPLLTLAKVHIVGASQFVQGCCSVVGHFRFNFVVWRSEQKKNKNSTLGKRLKDWKKQTGIYSQPG